MSDRPGLARLNVEENLLLAPGHQVGEQVWAALLEQESERNKRSAETLAFFGLDIVADAYLGG